MGYKTWRLLSVCVALSAFAVGCTNGPQKTSNGLASNNLQGNKQQQASTSFPIAGQDRNLQAQQQQQFGKPNLPQMQPPPNLTGGGLQNNQPSGLTPGTIQPTSREIPTIPTFPNSQPVNGGSSLPNGPVFPNGGGNVSPLSGSPAAPNFGVERPSNFPGR